MYAHQVVEDLTQHIDEYNLSESIANAEKFHLGEMWEIPHFNGLKSRLSIYQQYLRLPYPVCWFDWVEKIICKGGIPLFKKQGILVLDWSFSEEGGFIGFPLQHDTFWHTWGLSFDIKTPNSNEDLDFFNVTFKESGRALDDVLLDIVVHQVGRFCDAICLLHCKNIKTTEISAPKRLNKQREKHNKPPLYSYYTLQVEIPGDPNAKGGTGSRSNREIMRLHFCRGHFKHYTAEHPLFGKYTGLYWWQPHVRGSKKRGIINKDYEVIFKQ